MSVKIISHANSVIPPYVPVYNALYADIVNGVYPYDSCLPEEAELISSYNTESGALRRVLSILLEDGMVRQAEESFVVTYSERSKSPAGITNPMTDCARREITKVDVSYNYGPATEAALDKLNLRYNEIVLAGNIDYFADNDPVGHAFIQIPAKFVSEMDVNLNSEQEVADFLNSSIYDQAAYARLSFKNIPADSNFMPVPDGTLLIYIEEILFNEKNDAIARCKFYFMPDEYDVVLYTKNPSRPKE